MDNTDVRLVKVREAFKGSPQEAERQLALIGREHGDEGLALVSQELSPGEIFMLAKDGDSTKSSLAQAFVTPSQFRATLDFFGSRYKGPRADIAKDLCDFVYPFLFEGTVERRTAMVQGLLAHRLGLRILVAICLEDLDPLEFFATVKDHVHVEHGTWKEVMLFVRHVSPAIFNEIKVSVRELCPKGTPSEQAVQFSEKLCAHLIAEARRSVGDEAGPERPPDTFVNV